MAIKTLKRANQRRRTQQYRNQQKRTQKGGSGFFSSMTKSLKRNPTIISILKSLIEEKKAVKDAVTALPKQIINLYNVIEKLSTISSSKSSSSKKKQHLMKYYLIILIERKKQLQPQQQPPQPQKVQIL